MTSLNKEFTCCGLPLEPAWSKDWYRAEMIELTDEEFERLAEFHISKWSDEDKETLAARQT